MKIRKLPPDDELLEAVLTVCEAASLSHYTQENIRVLANTGRISARKAGKTWLISAKSLAQYCYPKEAKRLSV